MGDHFLWGVAHSAFQVEGSPAESDWLEWVSRPSAIADKSSPQVCTDFWNSPERDLAWVAELGAGGFRFSLAWERLEPKPGVFCDKSFAKYEERLRLCAEKGITPVVTLLHFVLPKWLSDHGGLLCPDFANHFLKYAAEVQKRLGKYLSFVITINEPMVQASFGYLSGIWPPGIKDDGLKASRAARNLIEAHALAFDHLKNQNPSLKISISKHWRLFEPRRRWNPAHQFFSKMADDFFNKAFLNGLLFGETEFSALGSRPVIWKSQKSSKPMIDFLGINYYGRMLVDLTLKPPFVRVQENPKAKIKSDLGWELYPQGLDEIFKTWKSLAPEIPLMITENGLADKKDIHRAKFLEDHVLQLLESSRRHSVDVLGYFHWSLTDNFEWAEGLEPRFGLVSVDYPQSGDVKDLKFKKRDSFYKYKELIEKHAKKTF